MTIQFPDFPPGLERVAIDGIELHYLALGQDFPGVLVHGSPINTIGFRVLDRLLPNREVRVIPDASHELFVENPEASTAAVLAFLDKH
jgi:hypothetical protein